MAREMAENLSRVLSGEETLRAAYLFGSGAGDQMRVDSDVDVAVWMDHPLDSRTKTRLIEAISSACRRPVDLVDLRRTDPVLLKEILQNGKPVIPPSPDVLESLFRAVVYNEADFLPLLRRARRERVEAFARG